MKKLLYFYWYVPSDYWHPIYDLHLRNLSLYKNIFDGIIFFISKDEDSNGVKETILSISYFIPDAMIIYVENNKNARESSMFYEYIVKRLDNFDEYTAVFFAHNKGVQTTYVKEKELENWINSMYYFNLRDVATVNNLLDDKTICAIGTGKIKNYAPHEFGKFLTYRWMFPGTFFWIVPKRVGNYVKEHNVKLYETIGRYYTEGFLGTIFPENAKECRCIAGEKKVQESWSEFIKAHTTEEVLADYEGINGKL